MDDQLQRKQLMGTYNILLYAKQKSVYGQFVRVRLAWSYGMFEAQDGWLHVAIAGCINGVVILNRRSASIPSQTQTVPWHSTSAAPGQFAAVSISVKLIVGRFCQHWGLACPVAVYVKLIACRVCRHGRLACPDVIFCEVRHTVQEAQPP